jgi:hypothetical protein
MPTPDPCVLTEAAAAAHDLADRFDGTVVARTIDPDVLLAPFIPACPAPRCIVEVFVDTTGILVVATGRDALRPLYWAHVPLPRTASPLAVKAMRSVLWFHALNALLVVVAPQAAGLFGP